MFLYVSVCFASVPRFSRRAVFVRAVHTNTTRATPSGGLLLTCTWVRSGYNCVILLPTWVELISDYFDRLLLSPPLPNPPN